MASSHIGAFAGVDSGLWFCRRAGGHAVAGRHDCASGYDGASRHYGGGCYDSTSCYDSSSTGGNHGTGGNCADRSHRSASYLDAEARADPGGGGVP